MNLTIGTKVFRYDLTLPPKIWDPDYRNIEYLQLNIEGIQKNHAGFYFFFDNKDVALNTAKVACEKSRMNSFYLTHAEITRELKLLDLTGCSNPLLMIQKLIDERIDILNESYQIFCSKDEPSFSILKETINYNLGIGLEPWERDVNIIHDNTIIIQKYLSRWNCPYTILGQLLTDYSNGELFKNELISKGFDGYCFDESVGGHTICLLNSEGLSVPQTIIVNIKENENFY